MPPYLSVPIVAAAIAIGLSSLVAGQETERTDAPSHAPRVEAILSEHCFVCHGQKKQSGKLDLRSLAAIHKGGKRGPAIVAADPDASLLFQVVQVGAKPHMPPGIDKQLDDDQIEVLRLWIAAMPQPGSKNVDERAGDNNSTDSIRADLAEATENTKGIHGNQATKAASSVYDEGDSRHGTPSWQPPPNVDPISVIDLLVQVGWQQRGVRPADRCSDAEFLRRVYLDLAGRIPREQEANAFLSNTSSDKREQLVDRLIGSADYGQHFAELFDVMLMGRVNGNQLASRKSHGWFSYLESSFRQNKAWNELAREVLLARGNGGAERGHLWFLYERGERHQEIAEAIAPNFFGIDVACAQCHDHPLAKEIEQRHYWGLVAFFKRSKPGESERGIAVNESAIGGFDEFADLSGSSQVAQLTFFRSDTVPESPPQPADEDRDDLYALPLEGEPRVPVFSRREAFVDRVLADHPLVARSMVNRMWGILLGRGIVHPIDKMDSTHPPSHPELLDWLADDFARHGYDVARLIRSIVLSRPYQLAARSTSLRGRAACDPDPSECRGDKSMTNKNVLNKNARESNELPAASEATTESLVTLFPEDAFAYAIEKPLIAEVFLRSVEVALETAPTSNHGQLSDVDPERNATADQQLAGASESLRDTFRELFPDVMPGPQQSTLKQTMMLSNHPEFHALVTLGVRRVTAASNAASEAGEGRGSEHTWGLTKAWFNRLFLRPPDDEELAAILDYLGERRDRPEQAIEQLVWALLTSAEFRFNH